MKTIISKENNIVKIETIKDNHYGQKTMLYDDFKEIIKKETNSDFIEFMENIL